MILAAGVPATHCVVIGTAIDGVFERQLVGDIDSIAIRKTAVSQGGVTSLYRRLTHWQPQIARSIMDLSPTSWPTDPARVASKIRKAIAQPLAAAESRAESLAHDGLPPRCEGALLQRWETCLALPRSPIASLSARQARTQQALRRELGFTAGGIKKGLAPLLGLTESQVEILRVTNAIRDGFGVLDTLRWRVEGNGSAAIASDDLVLSAAAGADLRYGGSYRNATRCWTLVADARDSIFRAKVVDVSVPADVETGIFISDGRNLLLFGAMDTGASIDVGWRMFLEYELGVRTVIIASTPQPFWIQLRVDANGIVNAGHSSAGDTGPFTEVTVTSLPGTVRRAGFYLRSDVAAISEVASGTFDDAIVWTPQARRPFYLWAYRDPMLSGTYDLDGARLQIAKQTAARDHASVCTVRAVEYDDGENGYGQAPLGGFE